MTTGDVPPNSDKGGSFGHDPKVCSIVLLILLMQVVKVYINYSEFCVLFFLLDRYQLQFCTTYTKYG